MRQQNDCFTHIVLTILVHSKVTWQRKLVSTWSSGEIIKSCYGSTFIYMRVVKYGWFTVTAWWPRRQPVDGRGRRSHSWRFVFLRSLRTTPRWQELPCSGRTLPRQRSAGWGCSTELVLGASLSQLQWSSLLSLLDNPLHNRYETRITFKPIIKTIV